MKILSAALILSIIIAPLPASATSVKTDDFAIKTVMAWKLAAKACNIDNLKSSACKRQEALDNALTSYGCFVNSATWQCPILPGKRSP